MYLSKYKNFISTFGYKRITFCRGFYEQPLFQELVLTKAN